MAVCPKCNKEYDAGEHFCRNCGSPLLTEKMQTMRFEGMESIESDKRKKRLICPKCQLLYEIGNYCRKCGSLLVHRNTFQEMDAPPLEKRLIKRWSKESRELSEKKKNLEICLGKLETQRDRVSSEVFNPMLTRYQDQLESYSFLHQEIEAQLESVKKRALEEIDLLEKKLKSLQIGLEETESLYRLGAMTQADFSRKKKAMMKEVKSRERSLKKYRQINSLLTSEAPPPQGWASRLRAKMPHPGVQARVAEAFQLRRKYSAGQSHLGVIAYPILKLLHSFSSKGWGIVQYFRKLGGQMASQGMARNLLRPFSSIAACGVILFTVAVGYFFWRIPSPSSTAISEEMAAYFSAIPSPVSEDKEVEKIKSLFENVRQANLKKSIDLFMSCYSLDFKDRNEKRLATLKIWKNFNYLDLTYHLKKQTLSVDTAHVKVEWLIRIVQKMGGPPQNSRTVLDTTLKREDGRWKIKEIKPAS